MATNLLQKKLIFVGGYSENARLSGISTTYGYVSENEQEKQQI
jgi:hypothetical protein